MNPTLILRGQNLRISATVKPWQYKTLCRYQYNFNVYSELEMNQQHDQNRSITKSCPQSFSIQFSNEEEDFLFGRRLRMMSF